jgi:hypothetical protein
MYGGAIFIAYIKLFYYYMRIRGESSFTSFSSPSKNYVIIKLLILPLRSYFIKYFFFQNSFSLQVHWRSHSTRRVQTVLKGARNLPKGALAGADITC